MANICCRKRSEATCGSVLRYVHFNADDLLASYRAKIERATTISAENRETYLAELSEGLKGYTYLED
jgi:arginine decarboxylase